MLACALDRALARGVEPVIVAREMLATGHGATNCTVVTSVERAPLDFVGLALRSERRVAANMLDGLKIHSCWQHRLADWMSDARFPVEAGHLAVSRSPAPQRSKIPEGNALAPFSWTELVRDRSGNAKRICELRGGECPAGTNDHLPA